MVEPAATPPLPPFAPPLWTTNSDRFLLRERQQELSLAGQADTVDGGDKPAVQPYSQPAPQSPPAPAVAARPAAESQPELIPPTTTFVGPVNSGASDEPQLAPAADGGLVDSLQLPPDEELISPPAEIIPSEQFSDTELLAADAAVPAGTAMSDGTAPFVNVIATSREQATRPEEPTLGEILSGEADDGALGSQVPGISPWRSAAIILVCLALLFASIAIGKRFKLQLSKTQDRSLAVIETISLGAGRQITIMEMGQSALILGVTSQSINLLDKVPLTLMSGSYQGTINAIIDKESRALPADWAERPVFTVPADQETPRLAPPLAGPTVYGPGGRRVSVGELRRRRARSITVGGTSFGRPAAARVGGDARTKAELIGRLREQLSRLEE